MTANARWKQSTKGLMHNTHINVFGILAALLIAGDAASQTGGLVDQEQPIIDITVGGLAIGGNSEQKLAQVVTPGVSGLLTEVRLPVACDSAADLRVEIQGVINGKPDGSVLAAELFAGTDLPSFFPTPGVVTLRSFTFTAPARVEAGQPFAIVLFATGSDPASGCGIFQGPAGDSYSRGNLFFDSRPNASGVWVCVCEFAGGRLDLPFQTVVAPPVTEVTIDVRPGSLKNQIRLRRGGIVPVAILGSSVFDVALVDIASVRFGPRAASAARRRGHRKDVNRDGWPDLVLYFRVGETGLEAGDREAALTGLTLNGERFAGADSIVVVGRKSFPPKEKK
jgi:hypothetical protein